MLILKNNFFLFLIIHTIPDYKLEVKLDKMTTK